MIKSRLNLIGPFLVFAMAFAQSPPSPAGLPQRVSRIVKDLGRAIDSKKLKLIQQFGLTVEEVPNEGYLRVVRVAIPEDLNMLKWATKFLPVDLGAVKGGNVVFRKFYRTYDEANGMLNTIDYLQRVPLTADIAMGQFQEGEQVSFESRLVFSTGLKTLSRLGLSPAGISGKVILTGTFLVQLKRLDGDRIKLAITSTQARDRRFKGHIGSDSEFQFLQAKVNGISLKDLNPQLFEYSKGQQDKKYLTFVYDIDLGQEAGKKFYNRLIQSGAVGDLEHMKDFVRNPMALIDGEIGSEMTLDSSVPVEHLEQVRQGDAVKVIYSGMQKQDGEISETKLFWGFSKSFKETSHKNTLVYLDESGGSRQTFIFDKMAFENGKRRLFGYWLAEDKSTTISIVSKSDSLGGYEGLLGLSAQSVYFAKGSNLAALNQWKRHFQLILPSFIHAQFWFQGWDFYEKVPGARVSLDIQFDPLFFERIVADVANVPDVKKYFELKAIDYLERVGDPNINTLRACYVKVCEFLRLRENDSVFYDYLDEIKKIAEIMTEYVEIGKTPEEKVRTLARLKSSALFKELGVGYLISLIPAEQLYRYISVDFTAENYDPKRADLSTEFFTKERSIHFGLAKNSIIDNVVKNEKLSRGSSGSILQPQIPPMPPPKCRQSLN
jgi:hypothetical protein